MQGASQAVAAAVLLLCTRCSNFQAAASAPKFRRADDYESATNLLMFNFSDERQLQKRPCPDVCHKNGACENGICVCKRQPWCGALCNRQCHNGGLCKSPPGECSCPMGWTGSMCEQPMSVDTPVLKREELPPGQRPAEVADGMVKVRVINAGSFGMKLWDDYVTCDRYMGMLEVPIPGDIAAIWRNIVDVKVRCELAEKLEMHFAGVDPMSGIRFWGNADRCDGFDADPTVAPKSVNGFDTAVMTNQRNTDFDFRYEVVADKIKIYMYGFRAELGTCNMKVSIMYVA